MQLVALFFAGMFLCNCIPHLAAGLFGQVFPTPFAKRRGVGLSSPLVNFYWGAFNLAAGLTLLSAYPPALGFNAGCLALALGTYLSRYFGKVR
jgi:hypothetical protein